MRSFWTCLQNVTAFGVLGNRLLNFSFWDMLTNFTFLFERKLAPFGTVLFYIIGFAAHQLTFTVRLETLDLDAVTVWPEFL